MEYDLLADKKMVVGESIYFNIMTTPKASFEERLSVKSLKSSNSKVLSVKMLRGSICMTAKKAGKATISATIANKKIKYSLAVEKPKINLSCPDSISLNVGESITVDVNSNINIIYIDQTGSSVDLITKEIGNIHSKDGKYQFTLQGVRSGVSTIEIYDNTGAPNPIQKKLKVTVSDNPISRIKTIIQNSGYENSEKEKYIAYQDKGNGVTTTFAIFDIYSDNRLFFYMLMDYGTRYVICGMDISSWDAGVTPTVMMVQDDSTFRTERSIAKRDLIKQNNLYFRIIERTGVFAPTVLDSNIQSISNSVLNASLAGWNYLLTQQCDSSLSTLGFTLYK